MFPYAGVCVSAHASGTTADYAPIQLNNSAAAASYATQNGGDMSVMLRQDGGRLRSIELRLSCLEREQQRRQLRESITYALIGLYICVRVFRSLL